MIRISAAFIATTLLIGCASSGPAHADGHNAIARSGDAVTNVNVSPTIALGDRVAEAASEAAKAYLSTISGPFTAAHREAATQRGVEAGLTEAADEGKTPTEAQEEELRQELRQAIEREVTPTAE